MSSSQLLFDYDIGKEKPESIINKDTKCPFCDRNNLEEIIAEKGSIILVKNKYPVLEDTFQTVLIETDNCHTDLSVYPKDHLYEVISFGLEKWLEMEKDGAFKSVLFFKNHGPKSGGTIFHPHMQIVGLKNIDYREKTFAEDFTGITIAERDAVVLNVSTTPRVGFFEFNIIMEDLQNIKPFADYIQITVHYILNHFSKHCDSYNIFFYKYREQIIAKIMPRFITSPIYIGYTIPQFSNRIYEVIEEIKEKYLEEKTG
ncbi:MAG: DUF4931 domain-containing protein [Peptococcaceae bacterium]